VLGVPIQPLQHIHASVDRRGWNEHGVFGFVVHLVLGHAHKLIFKAADQSWFGGWSHIILPLQFGDCP
jgi:hypothetical protein